MRLVYWYTPFADFELDTRSMAEWGNAYQEQNRGQIPARKVKTYFNCLERNPKLGGLKHGDRLYIAAHGDAAEGMLAANGKGPAPAGYTDAGGKPMLSPEQLVAVMENDGFEWKCVDIRVYACKAARGGFSFTKSFADLVQEKCPDTKVFGYTGMLDRTTGPGYGKMAKFDTGSSEMKSASAFRRPFLRAVPGSPTDSGSDEEIEQINLDGQVWKEL